jgi:hypothetical protein
MVTGAWGQKAETCHSCDAEEMNQQFSNKPPRHPKPEKAKEQRQTKHAPRAKNHPDTEIPRPKESTGGEHAQNAPSAAKQP